MQGLDQAPFVVRECYESWKKYNKDRDIRFMDKEELSSYVDIDPIVRCNKHTITKQKISNIARMNLMAPVYKLNWRVDEKRSSNGTAIEYLIEAHR